jgi:hypothetical protein
LPGALGKESFFKKNKKPSLPAVSRPLLTAQVFSKKNKKLSLPTAGRRLGTNFLRNIKKPSLPTARP